MTALRLLAALCATVVWVGSCYADCSSLHALAQQHANDMARRNSLDHAGFMQRRGPAGAIAENVAMGCETEPCARRMWMQSPPHRRNMMLGGCQAVASAGIGRWRSAATVVLVPAILASLSLEPPAEAAVTTALSAGISPSMEATRHDGRCPLLALSGHCVRRSKCPLSRVKRTSTADAFSSALALSPIRLAFALSQNSARLKDKRTGEQQCSSREAIPIQISWRI